jgi:hypothetical protein
MTQCDRIESYLRQGRSLTPLSALRLFDCFRLGARIHQLKRKGVPIKREIIELSSGKRVAQYSL